MLRGAPQIRSVRHLCRLLRCKKTDLQRICANPRYHKFSHKGRPISEPLGELRVLQKRAQYLLAKIDVPEFMHGGIKRRSPLTNARLHIGKAAVLNFDIKQFFPSVKPRHIYKMFYEYLRFPADVAHWLTKLVTFKGQLPQGAPTSTVVANLVILPLCRRLKLLASKHNSDYGQFVDDGTFSGPLYLENLRYLIEKIIRQEDFQASPKPHKRRTRYYWEEQVVNGVGVNKGITVPQEKLRLIQEQIRTLQGRSWTTGFENECQSVRGRILWARSLDEKKGQKLMQKLNSGVR
ncbi:MAG: RNA-directed DNA polymerase [Phycisphaerales bacterium]|nr:MAG: RNA-directed DNA polymerase [Phycisphaerales bacterium]